MEIPEKLTPTEYRTLFAISSVAALAMLVVIPLQVLVFVVVPPPTTSIEWFTLFNSAPLLAMFHSDLFLLVNNVLIAIVYLSFYHSLKDVNKGLMQLALVVGFIGIAAYVSSNKTFELYSLARQFETASSETDRLVLIAAAKAMTVGWQGTAFDTYYVLNAVTLLIVSLLMFRSPLYSRVTASFGLAAGVLMCIPSTAGLVGLLFSLLSLIPWSIFTLLYARTFRKLAQAGPY